MADLALIRAGIARNLSVIPDVQVSAYVLANPTPPVLQVASGEIHWDFTFARGYDEIMLKVQALVALNADVGTQVMMDEFRAGSGPMSVRQAIETVDGANGQATLGGIVDSVQVQGSSAVQLYVGGSSPQLFSEWEVQVLARGV